MPWYDPGSKQIKSNQIFIAKAIYKYTNYYNNISQEMIQSAIRGRQREIVNLRTDITKLLNTESISIQVSLFLFFSLISYTIDKEY